MERALFVCKHAQTFLCWVAIGVDTSSTNAACLGLIILLSASEQHALPAQAPATKEPDVSAFSQILTPAADPEQDAISSPEIGATPQGDAAVAGASQEGTASRRAQQSSTGDTLDYRETLRGCDTCPSMHTPCLACVLRSTHFTSIRNLMGPCSSNLQPRRPELPSLCLSS